jgi:hypothetical protein
MRGFLALLCLIAACDSKATANDPGGGARAEQKSREYESCSASIQCQDELRCFDHACRRTARSTVGDYYAALGLQAKARGDNEAAIAAYAQAINQYQAENIKNIPVPDIDCAYGAALAAAKQKHEHAELAARVLHRCVLAAPVGSSLREQAIAQLATLSDVGLDPLLLGAPKTADLYLTKGPAMPSSDKVNVTVTASPSVSGKSYSAVPDKIAELKPQLVPCWETYTAASKKDTLAVTIPLKVSYYSNPDYEGEGGFTTKVEAPSGNAASPEGAAGQCVYKIIEPAIKDLKLTDSMSTKLTITIK